MGHSFGASSGFCFPGWGKYSRCSYSPRDFRSFLSSQSRWQRITGIFEIQSMQSLFVPTHSHSIQADTRRGTFTKPVNLFPSPQQYLPQPAVTTSAPTICKVSILFNIHYLGVHQVHHPGFDLRGTVSVEREDDHVPSLPWSRKYGRIPKPWRVCRSGLAGFGLGTTFLSCWLQAVSMLGERCRTVEGNSSFLHNATPRPSPWITKGLEIGHSGDKRQQQTKMG